MSSPILNFTTPDKVATHGIKQTQDVQSDYKSGDYQSTMKETDLIKINETDWAKQPLNIEAQYSAPHDFYAAVVDDQPECQLVFDSPEFQNFEEREQYNNIAIIA